MQAGLVKDLSPRGPKWQVTVRLTRIWENKDRDQKMYELGLLFIDQQGNMIEGCLPENRIPQFGDKLKEGLVYKIDRFMVASARNKYRTVEHAHKIRITQQTRLAEVDPEPIDFPLYAYNARPFDVLAKRMGQVTVLSDVIGVVHKLTDIIPSKTNCDPRRQVFLKNERPAIVTLWGKHAETFNAEALYEASLEHNVPVLFMAMTVDSFSGMLAFKSTPLTRWLFDPQIPEATILRDSPHGDRYIIGWDGQRGMPTEPTETTPSDLATQETCDIVRKKFNLRIKITSINNPHNWWFYACKSCWRKMVPAGGIRRCPDCRGTEDEQRYKISVNARHADPTCVNDKVVGDFLFFGKHGTALTGKEAVLLAAQARGRPDFVPPAIASVVGNEYAVTAEVKKDTYDAEPGHIILNVSKVELLTPSAGTKSPQKRSDPLTAKETYTSTGTSTIKLSQTEIDRDGNATPVKDAIDSVDDDTEADLGSVAYGKRKKSISLEGKGNKKSSDSNNKRAAKELFPQNQKN